MIEFSTFEISTRIKVSDNIPVLEISLFSREDICKSLILCCDDGYSNIS